MTRKFWKTVTISLIVEALIVLLFLSSCSPANQAYRRHGKTCTSPGTIGTGTSTKDVLKFWKKMHKQ
jgi:ABC-type transport system involved in multi-copper enzyme maturation permease subunit